MIKDEFEIKKLVLQRLNELKLFSKVKFVILFGSVSKGKSNPLSDIDICVSLSSSSKERLKARIKLLGNLPEKYDIQIFEDLPLYIQKEVLSGNLLYCKNKKNLVQLALKVIQEYDDFKPIYDFYLSQRKESVKI